MAKFIELYPEGSGTENYGGYLINIDFISGPVIIGTNISITLANLFTKVHDSILVLTTNFLSPTCISLLYLSPKGSTIKSYKLFINTLNRTRLI